MLATFFYQLPVCTGEHYQVSFKKPTVFSKPTMPAIQLMFEKKNGNEDSNETGFIVWHAPALSDCSHCHNNNTPS